MNALTTNPSVALEDTAPTLMVLTIVVVQLVMVAVELLLLVKVDCIYQKYFQFCNAQGIPYLDL